MLQPARVLLFNQRGPARKFREKLFGTFGVEEVVNFSALRFTLFEHADDPVCAVTLSPGISADVRISYICPKPTHTSDDDYQFTIESPDVHHIHQQDAASDPYVWSAFVWGGQRDLIFVRWLRHLMSLESLKRSGVAKIRRGISRGDRRKQQSQIGGKRILEADEFPSDTFLTVKAKEFPINADLRTHSKDSTDFSAFALPQLILKQSWQKGHFRFQAALVESDAKTGPLLCSRSYAGVHVPEEKHSLLEAACAVLNSKLAVYCLLLTSGRFASYREEPNLEDLLRVPIPDAQPGLLQGITDVDDLDTLVRDTFGFKDAEWVLVEDLFTTTLADFKGAVNSPGRQATQRTDGSNEEPQLRQYCEYFIRVLRASFGQDKNVSATVFQEKTSPWLPFRFVAFHLNCDASPPIRFEALESGALLEELEQLNQKWLQTRAVKTGTIYHQRVARIYEYQDSSPTIYIIKPDACRYWTRSMGLHDADEVAADFMRWQMASVETMRR